MFHWYSTKNHPTLPFIPHEIFHSSSIAIHLPFPQISHRVADLWGRSPRAARHSRRWRVRRSPRWCRPPRGPTWTSESKKWGKGWMGGTFFWCPGDQMSGRWMEYEWNMNGIWVEYEYETEYGIRMVPWVEPMFWFNVPKLSSECHLVSLVSLVP